MNEEIKSRTKPILLWPGGKSRLLKKLLPLIPEHDCYGEVFGGGLALFGAKPRSPLEIINDLNGDLIALYLNVQRHLPEMLRQINLAISSRELLFKYVAQPGLTDIERAARFLIRNRTSFGGGGDSFAVARSSKGGGAGINRDKQTVLLEQMHERLNGVVIEHLSWERFLELYDREGAFFFCDPPYVGAPTGVYDGWTEKDATALRNRLRKCKAQWLVTINDSPFTRDLFGDCTVDSVVTRNGGANNRTHSTSTFGELALAKLQAAGKVPTNLTAGQVRAIDASIRRYAAGASQDLIEEIVDNYKKALLDLVNPQQVARATEDGGTKLVTEGLNPATARNRLTALLEGMGEDAPTYRVDFAIKVGQAVSQGAGRHIQQNLNEDVLDEYPALEFVRLHDRDVPRGFKTNKDGELIPDPDQDWPTRWEAACDESGDEKSLSVLQTTGRMVALKSSGVWQALGDGAGGYTDTLGNSFDPMAFNTGYRQLEVDRDETESLGLIAQGEKAEPSPIDFKNLFSFGGVA